MNYVVAIVLIVFCGPSAVHWAAQFAHCHPMIAAVTVVSGAIYTAAAVENSVER